MIKVKDGYAKLVGTTASGSASHILLSNGGVKAVSDFVETSALDNYLPLSGGTMNGVITMPINYQIQWGSSSMMIYGEDTNAIKIVAPLGLYVNSKEVWHSGNDGSGSGLDADLLDGRHSSGFAIYEGVVGANVSSVAASIGYTYATQEHGGLYAGGFINFGTNGYFCQLHGNVSQSALAYRFYNTEYGKFSDWKSIAFTDSNVASATQVMINYSYNQDINYPLVFTSRDNIGVAKNGDLYIDFSGRPTYNPKSNTITVGNINMTGSINNVLKVTTSQGAAMLNIAEVTADINYIHLYVSSLNSTYATTRPLVLQNGYGNVGIGTPTPGYKLHVAGTTFSTGFVKSESSDSYVLLGGGGHKSISSFQTTYDGRYVLKAGDTMTGPLTISTSNWGNQLVLNRVNNGENWGPSIIFKFDGTHNGSLTMQSNQLYVGDNGVTRYKAWHEGNDGSGSGLDADLLDGTHKTGLLTALSSSSSTNLSITVGGTTKSITNTYATNITLISCYNGTTNNDLWSTIKTGNSTYLGTANIYEVYNDGGPTTYGEVLDIVSAHTNHWQAQLWFGAGKTGHLYYRNKDYNDATLGSWRTILDTGNYSSYALPFYTKTSGDCNSMSQGLTVLTAVASNQNGGNHSAFLTITSIGTPFQLQIPDSSEAYIYKRYKSGSSWSAWSKLSAGYADSAGSVAWGNITGKPSSFTPASHNHNGSYVYTGGMVNGAYAVIPTYNGETGWHRIATIDGGTGYGSWILYLCGNWSWASNTNAILHINTVHTTARITQVSGIVGFATDVRLVPISANNYYVDVYINYSGANTPGTVYCYFLGNGAITTRTTVEKITASVSTAASITLVTGTKTNDSSYAAHFYENSDIRYKTIINNLTIKANQLANLPLFDFKWQDNEDQLNTGTSAQAVQELLPYIVSGTDKLTLDYGVLGTIAGITACRELTEQEKEINELKEQIKFLKDEINNLKTNKLWQS